MKNTIKYIILFFSSSVFACGGGDWGAAYYFYNLFNQTNISASEYYPFLNNMDAQFSAEGYLDENGILVHHTGNVHLWKEILNSWDLNTIDDAIYKLNDFNWKNHNSPLEQQAKIYMQFAQECSAIFNYRSQRDSWNYDEITAQGDNVDSQELLSRANILASKVTNPQLKARYYYQIIRILHYTQQWDEAINFYEANIENKFQKNEIYYYIADQVAGCYYSMQQYDKAAFIFTKVLNNSYDRKTSALLSFNLCANKNAEGKPFITTAKDEKDLLLVKCLRGFSDELLSLNEFITFDAKDPRIELLFIRELNTIESAVWPKRIGANDQKLPQVSTPNNHYKLLKIAESQVKNTIVTNKDFWKIASSYLSFINQDLEEAKNKLKKVKTFKEQKQTLSIVYDVFSWKTISAENEKYIFNVLNTAAKHKKEAYEFQNDLHYFILDIVAHTYYENNELAKAFLVHNKLEIVNNIGSLKMLNALEDFYNKPNKTDYENSLLSNTRLNKRNFLDYVNYQKGIYYLQHQNPELALLHFQKSNNVEGSKSIPNTIFSNNIKECFDCIATDVMEDEVYKASVFSFIKTSFTRKELAANLVELKKLTTNEKQWVAKLSNYLLANYYFNISNTGYYRGLLTDDNNCCDYNYINYANDTYNTATIGSELIEKNIGFNLSTIGNYENYYFGTSNVAYAYYQKVIDVSSDKELNARCFYLMAKCELNAFYNTGEGESFKVNQDEASYYQFSLPKYKSFKVLKESYADTQFHNMIIKECSYYELYANQY